MIILKFRVKSKSKQNILEKKLKKILLLVFTMILFFSCDFFKAVNPEEEEPALTTEEIEASANLLLDEGKLDEALDEYQKVIDSGEASEEAIFWWTSLKISSLAVDSNILEIATKLGLSTYPKTMNDAYMNDSFIPTNGNIMPAIENSSMFTQFDSDNNNVSSSMLALLYNLQKNYPDGFDGLIDSAISASEKLDDILNVLTKISDDASLDLKYSMFNDDTFDPTLENWPVSVEGSTTPAVVTVGKAEVYLMCSTIELLRSILLMLQSVDYSADLDGYWSIFNPLNGNFYTFDLDGTPTGIKEDFDYSKIPNPLNSGFLQQSDDAIAVLAESRTHFANVFKNIKASSILISNRTESSNFFLSPANASISLEDWNSVIQYHSLLETTADKIIDSIENNKIIYIPELEGMTEDDLKSYSDPAKWPTSGIGINLGKLFSKPLFALDNMFDLETNGDLKLYQKTGTTYSLATSYNEAGDYRIKIKDITFNGLLNQNITDIIPQSIVNTEDISGNDIYLTINTKLAGHKFTPKGSNFTYNGATFTSAGSIFTGFIIDLDSNLRKTADINTLKEKYYELDITYSESSNPSSYYSDDHFRYIYIDDSKLTVYKRTYDDDYNSIITYKDYTYIEFDDGIKIGENYGMVCDDGGDYYMIYFDNSKDFVDVDSDNDLTEIVNMEVELCDGTGTIPYEIKNATAE